MVRRTERTTAILGLAAIIVLAFLAGALMGLVLRLPGFAALLVGFVLLTLGLWVMVPERGPSTVDFVLSLVFLQIGYLVGSLIEAAYLSKQSPSRQQKPAKPVSRESSFWLK